jgi:hypothetical protein
MRSALFAHMVANEAQASSEVQFKPPVSSNKFSPRKMAP